MKKNALEILEYSIKKAKKLGASSADAVLIENNSINVRTRLRKVETVESSDSHDLGIRVFSGKKGNLSQAIVSTNDLDKKDIDKLLEQAVLMAKAAPHDPFISIAEKNDLKGIYKDLKLEDKKPETAENLIKKALKCEEAAFTVKGITNSEGAESSYSHTNVSLATSNGFAKTYRTTSFATSVSIIAGKDLDMQVDYDYHVARLSKDLRRPEEIGIEAAKRAVSKLKPRKISTCKIPIIFEARIAKSLLSSLASSINGAAVARKTTFLIDKMGKQIFPKNINIVDDPTIISAISSRPFDAEGFASRKTKIVENGVLKSWLLDLRSAKQLKLKTTGHASRGISSPPSPSSTNFYMTNGKVKLKDMIKGIKKGFYLTDAFGMGVNQVTGDYSQGASGFMIENGKITYPVSEITIAGNLKDMFMNLTPADDLEFLYGTNSPSLLIEGMTIAGK